MRSDRLPDALGIEKAPKRGRIAAMTRNEISNISQRGVIESTLYLQTSIGYQVKTDMPGLKGAEVEALYRQGKEWLAGAPPRV